MLGELISETKGKRSARRVIRPHGGALQVEVSFEETGHLLGGEIMGLGTYTSTPNPDGTLQGEGQGVNRTAGGEMISWKGAGVGKFTGHGSAMSWRGAIFYQTTSPKFARLTGVTAVFEHEVDAEGNTHSKIWEWK